MRGFAAVAALVILAAVGLSLLVLPSSREVGTMLLRDQKYDQSRAYFEQQIAAGDISPQTIAALLQIYTQYGDVDRAIALVERYESEVGTTADVLARLADLYFADRRHGLYVQALTRLVEVAPTLERLETLAEAHYRRGDPLARTAVLRKIRELGLSTAQHLLDLGELEVVAGNYIEAVDAYETAWNLDASSFDWSYRIRLFELAMRAGPRDRGVEIVRRAFDGTETPAIHLAFAQSALANDHAELAVELLLATPTLEMDSEPWRTALAFALRRTGRDDEAWDYLSRWWAKNLLPMTAAPDFVDLALGRQRLDIALAVVDKLGIEMLGTPVVVSLVSALHRAGRMADVDAVLERIGTDALADAPVLAAEILLARDDRVGAERFADLALASTDLTYDERITLASILSDLGRDEGAFDLLSNAMTDPEFPVEGMLLLGQLYGRLGLSEDGYWDLTSLLARRNTPRLRAVWANLAMLTDRRDVVLDWLAREPDVDPIALTDLYFTAERLEAWPIAVETARRLLAIDPGGAARMRLAFALYRVGDNEAALSAIAPVVPRDQSAEPLYADILRALGRTEELLTLWRVQFARPTLDPEERRNLLYALLEAGADDVVWEDLVALAIRDGGGWWYTLAQSAARLGRKDILAEVVAARVSLVDPRGEDATSMVYALAEVDRAATLPILKALTSKAPEQWSDAYLSTLRDLDRTDELIAWTTGRLSIETDATRALSLAYGLAEMAPARRAATAIEPHATKNREFAQLYADVLRRAGRPGDAVAFEVSMVDAGRFGDEFADGVAFRALESGDRKTAERLFRRLAAAAGPDSDIMKQLFYLWGPRPRADVLDWLENRARAADGADRTVWITKLIELRAGERAASVIGGVDKARGPGELMLLVRARALGEDRKALSEAIAATIGTTRSTEDLREVAAIAEASRDRGHVIKAWLAFLRIKPSNPEAHRTLGLIAYDEGRLIDAERHLGAFLSGGDGDHETNYFYGEVLTRTDRAAQAMPFYRRALDQLMAKPKREFLEEVARASLLRRLGKVEDAVELMAALLDQRPTDRSLRADFADLLIQKGDLRRARTVLRMK